MSAETRHPLAGTKQSCPVCGGVFTVREWGALEAHNIIRETWWIESCSGGREILPVPEAAPVPSTPDDLRDRVRAAIADPGAHVKRAWDETGAPAESLASWSARAVLAAVVGPELARRDAENDQLRSEFQRWTDYYVDYAQTEPDRLSHELFKQVDANNELRAERDRLAAEVDQLRNGYAELYTANGKLLDAARREVDQLSAEIGAFVGRLRQVLNATAPEVPAERGETT